MKKIDYRLYLVTDNPSRYGGDGHGRDWIENVVAAVEGGVTCVQYRDVESSREVQYERLRRLQDALASRHTPIIVNNDAELAAAVRAEGIHVGQSDMAPEAVRKIVGTECEIGLSITSPSQLAMVPPVVDCLGIGPVFDARKTKADAAQAMGVEGLTEILRAARPLCLDTVAIGGIKFDNASAVLSSGVGGVAVVSAFSQAGDPYEVARNFSLLFDDRRI